MGCTRYCIPLVRHRMDGAHTSLFHWILRIDGLCLSVSLRIVLVPLTPV